MFGLLARRLIGTAALLAILAPALGRVLLRPPGIDRKQEDFRDTEPSVHGRLAADSYEQHAIGAEVWGFRSGRRQESKYRARWR